MLHKHFTKIAKTPHDLIKRALIFIMFTLSIIISLICAPYILWKEIEKFHFAGRKCLSGTVSDDMFTILFYNCMDIFRELRGNLHQNHLYLFTNAL